MQSLTLNLQNREEQGDPLPSVFERFEELRILYRRGQMSLVAGAGGGGKSSLATYEAVRMAYDEHSGVPCLYYSADCDMATVAASILSSLMEIDLEDAEYLIGQEDSEALELLEKALDHMWFSFKTSPTLQDIQDEIWAYAFVMGEFPHLIIIDNLVNINEPGEEKTRLPDIMIWFSDLARATNAHVKVLHHVTGEYQNGDIPIPRTGIKWKVSDLPRLCLTLFRPQDGMMGVRVVKNTNGPSNTKAQLGVDLGWEPEKGWFSQ